MKNKQKLRIIEKALALGAEIHITDEGDKTIIEIKKAYHAPITIPSTDTNPLVINPTWSSSTWSSSSCEKQKD